MCVSLLQSGLSAGTILSPVESTGVMHVTSPHPVLMTTVFNVSLISVDDRFIGRSNRIWSETDVSTRTEKSHIEDVPSSI